MNAWMRNTTTGTDANGMNERDYADDDSMPPGWILAAIEFGGRVWNGYAATCGVIALLAFVLLIAGCTPETATRIRFGDDYGVFPKAESAEYVEYIYENVKTGEKRSFKIKNSHADPSAALDAFAKSVESNNKVVEAAINKIPAVK